MMPHKMSSAGVGNYKTSLVRQHQLQLQGSESKGILNMLRSHNTSVSGMSVATPYSLENPPSLQNSAQNSATKPPTAESL